MTEPRLHPRRVEQLRTYAEGGVQAIDPLALATAAMRSRRRRSIPSPRRSLVLIAVSLLLAASMVGALFVGSQPGPDPRVEMPVVEGPRVTDAPVQEPVVSAPEPTGDLLAAGESAAIGAGPCAAMVQRLAIYGTLEDPVAPLPPSDDSGSSANGDLLVTTRSERGEVVVGRLDMSLVPPEPITSNEEAFGHFPGFPMHAMSRIVASPDGAAVAVEEGDLGPAGCGDPLVVPVGGGIRRPFPAGSFELVTDLAWAPDGSALYAVRRPTIDANSRPFVDETTNGIGRGPGTVLRWDATTGLVTDLGSPCAGCGIDSPAISPDGERLAVNQRRSEFDVGSVAVREPDGTWRTVAQRALVVGWADDETLVLRGDGTQMVTLDGTVLDGWDNPCCHGTGYAALLSPDGTTLAGMTLSSDFQSWRVTLLDVRDGTTREVWEAPERRGCTAFGRRSTGRLECDATSGRSPGATLAPAISISGYARVVAWAPDGSAVVVLDQRPDSSDGVLRVVQIDGSGSTPPVTVTVPDLTESLGFPNLGPSVAWLATPE